LPIHVSYSIGYKDSAIYCLASLPNSRLASGSKDKTIKIWNTINLTLINTLYGHTESVRCLIYINNNRLASGSVDKTIRIWNISNVNAISLITTLSDGHSKTVNVFSYLKNNSILASGSLDRTIIIWNLNNYTKLKTINNGHKSSVTSLTFLNIFTLIISGESNKILIWNLTNNTITKTLKSTGVISLATINENTFTSISKYESIIWNLTNMKDDSIDSLKLLNNNNNYYSHSLVNENEVAIGLFQSIIVWNYKMNKIINKLDDICLNGYVSFLVNANNYELFAACSNDNRIIKWIREEY
jgi:WD40 repeat protein